MSLPEIVRAWLPGSFPKRRSEIPKHLTHELALHLMDMNRWFTENYWEADRLIVQGYFNVAMGSDDFWNIWAEAAELRLTGKL